MNFNINFNMIFSILCYSNECTQINYTFFEIGNNSIVRPKMFRSRYHGSRECWCMTGAMFATGLFARGGQKHRALKSGQCSHSLSPNLDGAANVFDANECGPGPEFNVRSELPSVPTLERRDIATFSLAAHHHSRSLWSTEYEIL